MAHAKGTPTWYDAPRPFRYRSPMLPTACLPLSLLLATADPPSETDVAPDRVPSEAPAEARDETPTETPAQPAVRARPPRAFGPFPSPLKYGGPGWPLETTALFGDLLGVRDELLERGVRLEGELTLDFSDNFTGGLRTGYWGLAFLDLMLQVDTAKAFDLAGGLFHIEMQASNELSGASYPLGDYAYYDEVFPGGDGTRAILSSLFWRQSLLDGLVEIQFGKSDVLSNFAFLDGGASFLSDYASYPTPLVAYAPTWGNPATGLELALRPAENVLWHAAWYDGSTAAYDPASGGNGPATGGRGPKTFFDDPGAAFLINELRVSWTLGDGLDGLVKGGAWWHLGETSFAGPPDPATGRLVRTVVDDAFGVYASGQQALWRATPEGGGEVNLFGGFGWGDPSTNPAQWSAAAGLTFTGMIPGRPDDLIGVLGGWTRFTRNAGITALGVGYGLPSAPGGSETALEIHYQCRLTPWLTVQPDLQWIGTPSGALDDAIVATLRFSMVF